MRESIEYLENWLKDAEHLARELRAEAQRAGALSIFTISTTAKIRENGHPFLTPLRRITHSFIGGSIVFSQTQAILLCRRIDGIVDQVLMDAEKKIGISLGIDNQVLTYFNMEPSSEKAKARIHVEMGNLSAACALHVKISQFREFKPNDMTVESVWHFLSSWFHLLNEKRIAIIGGGNIGFKLALKLVECGCHVELVRRDMARGMLMADVINIAKPQSTMAIAHYNQDALQAALYCDALIGCTNGVPAINWEMIQSMKPEGLVVDVGKGSVFKDAIEKAVQAKINIIRCDISSAIDGLIATMQKNHAVMFNQMGRREIEAGVFVVSGGYMGLLDDVVVDNYRNPSRIIGVADGMGDLVNDLSPKNRHHLSIIKAKIGNEG
ncbi:NAD(P)-dependent oxidoreductase [Deltaproteobacteria bacterium TL4]